MSDAISLIGERVRAAVANKQSLCIRGGGSKDFYGNALVGAPLETNAHSGIVDYEPSELVVTARCGTPLSELEAVLAEKGQMLAFEPPHFGLKATVGGMLATGLSGPRRQSAGAVRDFVLGVRIMDGRGEVLSFGGRVMKNVAGYDVSRLMAGSMGTLGVILDTSLKTLPIPPAETTLRFEMPEEKCLAALNRWAAQPLPVSASAWVGNELSVRLSGAAAAVSAAQARLGGECLSDDIAIGFWRSMREQDAEFFSGEAPLWRLSLPSTVSAQALDALPGSRLIEWGGALRWIATHADATAIREIATACGGHATLFRGSDKSCGAFHLPDASLVPFQRRLKESFDPHSVFNPGRLYGDI